MLYRFIFKILKELAETQQDIVVRMVKVEYII